MKDNTNDKIKLLLQKLETLYKRQDNLLNDIHQLNGEISRLKAFTTGIQQKHKEEIQNPAATRLGTPAESPPVPQTEKQPVVPGRTGIPGNHHFSKTKSDFEKFIGENLINKIGIIIIVLGIAIGAKYAIDKHLISPLTRILLGYLAGILLLGFSLRLRKKYENFSAVLLSGSAAVLYFITYTAYGFYDLIPQIIAFALMILFTVFTVWAAIIYNKQVIAHIGLVGAYAVPFLLSEGSGEVAILFTYMTIINTGIAAIAFRKYWKPLYYVSFIITWLIFGSWYFFKYETSSHFNLALVFLTIFFVLFYLIFLAYKLFRKDKLETNDIFLLLANSFVFYGSGYSILYHDEGGKQLLGFFTLCNALIHALVSVLIYSQKPADKNLFYFISGLMLAFFTIAIPVQLEGNWVTLLWAGEAALLFRIGRSGHVSAYEKLSYPVMALAFFSLIYDWATVYNNYNLYNQETKITPLLNIHFLTSLLCIAAFGWINLLKLRIPDNLMLKLKKPIPAIINTGIPFVLLCSAYFAFRLEIVNYWDGLFPEANRTIDSEQSGSRVYLQNDYFQLMKSTWVINYSLLFFSVISVLNYFKLKNIPLGRSMLALTVIAIFTFLTKGLYVLSELRENRLDIISLFPQKATYIFGIRYISLAFISLALFSCFQYLLRMEKIKLLHVAMEFVLHITILWIASSELINGMTIAGSTQSYKLGLSILWGCYSLFMVILGIWKRKRYLRIGAIGLFGVTLIKLFFYDLTDLDTISKTIVLVALGMLLLIISFMYNKYRQII